MPESSIDCGFGGLAGKSASRPAATGVIAGLAAVGLMAGIVAISRISAPTVPAKTAAPATGQLDLEQAIWPEEPVPPMARQVARFRIEYPDFRRSYPPSGFESFPARYHPLMRRAEIENDLCHSSGDDAEAYRGCNSRDALVVGLGAEGICAEGTERAKNPWWTECAYHPELKPRVSAPAPLWSDREIARIPWEVAALEQPCAAPGSMSEQRRLQESCVEQAWRKQDGLLNAAYVKLLSGMSSAARARMRQEQRNWLKRREQGTAECADHVSTQEATRDLALTRCRTGMTVPRRRDIQLTIAIAGEMWDRRLDRSLDSGSSQTFDYVGFGKQNAVFQQWQLRNTEKRAQRIIAAAPTPGTKRLAIGVYLDRRFDPGMTPEAQANFINTIAKVKESMK